MALIFLKYTTPPPKKKNPKVSRRHLLTLERIWGPCGAAREQASVSCVCSKAGEGRPASSKESGDPGKWEGGALCGKAKAQRGEKRAATKHFPSRETEKERARGR